MGAKGPRHSLPIQILTSLSSSSNAVNGMLISLSVCSIENGHELKLNDVMTVDRIPMKANLIPDQRDLDRYKHLQGVRFIELENESVNLLIGLDVLVAFRPVENRYGNDGEPDAIRTALGWTLFGPSVSSVNEEASCMQVTVCENEGLEGLPELAPHEATIPYELEGDSSREDRVANRIMKKSVQVVDGHLQLPLL